jgi:hypothetical protein
VYALRSPQNAAYASVCHGGKIAHTIADEELKGLVSRGHSLPIEWLRSRDDCTGNLKSLADMIHRKLTQLTCVFDTKVFVALNAGTRALMAAVRGGLLRAPADWLLSRLSMGKTGSKPLRPALYRMNAP